jgi:hypothetical protein
LAEEVIQLLGTPQTSHAFYAGLRLMALDSFVVDVADMPANERAFGRPGSGRAEGAFPQVRVLSLCEAGTHVLWRSLVNLLQEVAEERLEPRRDRVHPRVIKRKMSNCVNGAPKR